MEQARDGYGFGKELETTDFDAAKQQVVEALKKEGFGVLTEIDVKATLKNKLDVDFRPYAILGACNPPLAHKALQAESDVGLLLPCNVVVQKASNGKIRVSAIDPMGMLAVTGNHDLDDMAAQVDAKLRRVIESLE